MKKTQILPAVFIFLSMVIIGVIAYLANLPFVFPSLGPTAYLIFYRPESDVSSPRNAVLGHLVGVVSGLVGLALFGLIGAPTAYASDMSYQFIGSAAVALTLTAILTKALKSEHPPAGATTLIIALGIIDTVPKMIIMIVAIVFFVFFGWLCNHLAGIKYPLWSPRR